MTGRDAATALEQAGITVNKNAIPFDKKEPVCHVRHPDRDAVRNSAGMGEEQMWELGALIVQVLRNSEDEAVLSGFGAAVASLAVAFPVP